MHAGRFFNRLSLWILLTPIGIQTAAIAVTDDEIARAIKQLGAPEFKQREEATKFLWSVGRPAMPALEQASKSSDPEIALRARQLLTQLQHNIGPDTPADIRELLRRFHATDLEGRKNVVSELVELGVRAYPTLIALAESEPSPTQRMQILEPALEQVGGQIERAFSGEHPDSNELARAVTAIRLLQTVAPEDLSVPLLTISRLDKLGKKKEADEIFEAAFAFHKKRSEKAAQDPNPDNDLAWLCAVCHRRLNDALELSQKAIALAPKNPAYLDTLAEVHFQKGNRERAVELIKQCIELAPDNDYFRKQRDRFEKGDPAMPPPEPE
jgi:tetratricopeptide (TPR) repeat protein